MSKCPTCGEEYTTVGCGCNRQTFTSIPTVPTFLTGATVAEILAEIERIKAERDATARAFSSVEKQLEEALDAVERTKRERDDTREERNAALAEIARITAQRDARLKAAAASDDLRLALATRTVERDEARERSAYLSHFLEEAAHAAASGHDPSRYLATSAPTALQDEIKRLTKEVEKQRTELARRFDIINSVEEALDGPLNEDEDLGDAVLRLKRQRDESIAREQALREALEIANTTLADNPVPEVEP